MERANKVFILGNGESRKSVDLDALKEIGPIYGCNALYRDFTPDALICVDGGMMHEVYASGYASKNKCYYRSWTKLPGEAYEMLVGVNLFEGWHNPPQTENPKQGRTQFVMNGTDPNQMMRLVQMAKKIAEDEGISIETRPITLKEVMDGNFKEAGACGTAVVVTPVNKIMYRNQEVRIGNGVGPVLRSLYDRMRRIQNGEEEDKFGWLLDV